MQELRRTTIAATEELMHLFDLQYLHLNVELVLVLVILYVYFCLTVLLVHDALHTMYLCFKCFCLTLKTLLLSHGDRSLLMDNRRCNIHCIHNYI